MISSVSVIHWLVILSIAISISGAIPYIRDTLSAKTKPNRVSWFMWAFAALVSAGAAISAGADLWITSRVLIAGLIPLTVFLFSFVNKESYWKLTPFDFLCGILSLFAIIMWLFVDSPQVAVLLALAGDAVATLPTVIKGWKYPETETGYLYVASIISALLVLPAIPTWDIINSAFQIYLVVITGMLAVAVYHKRIFNFFK